MASLPLTARSYIFLAVSIAGLAVFYGWISSDVPINPPTVNRPPPVSSLPVTFQTKTNALERQRFERVLSPPPPRGATPDTTAVILNWSRLPNVIYIASLLCEPGLDHIIRTVVIWNNNPHKLSYKHFVRTGCPKHKLKIHNSPQNIYFQARFIACAQADTPYCFIQDDDYVVWPEVLQTLHTKTIEQSSPGIHLLPPHERFSSDLRRLWVSDTIHTSFAWLGHGAMIPRNRVVEFLALLGQLNFTEEQMRMADNYYTILSNTIVETWFDQGYELGGGQPFTVGVEGDERNNRHTHMAVEILDSMFSEPLPPRLPYTKFTEDSADNTRSISRAPCLSAPCLLETSISLFPKALDQTAAAADRLLARATANQELLGEESFSHYVSYSPSRAVDGNPETAFCSPVGAIAGDYVGLDMLRTIGSDWESVYLVLLVDDYTVDLLRKSIYEVSDGETWADANAEPQCVNTHTGPEFGRELWECSIRVLPASAIAGARYFRVSIGHEISEDAPRWCIHEMWLKGIRE